MSSSSISTYPCPWAGDCSKITIANTQIDAYILVIIAKLLDYLMITNEPNRISP